MAQTGPALVHSQPQAHVASGDGGRGPASSVSHRLRAGLLHAGLTFGLLALICAAYLPSLRHTPRSDDWAFRVDTIDLVGFWETFIHTYSYNRTRLVLPCDSQLFRPVLFAMLSAEKALFGNDFTWSQAVGIGLHCVTVLLFLRLLLQYHQLAARKASGNSCPKGWITERRLFVGLAYALALFFGLNYAIVEMVTFSHLHGYMLFNILMLGALLLCSKVLAQPLASPVRQGFRLAGAFLLVLVSAFTYEIGQFFAVIAGAALGASTWRTGRRFRALAVFVLFASILPIYQGINHLDRLAHPVDALGQYDSNATTIWERFSCTQTLKHAIRYISFAVVQPFFPSFASRCYFNDFDRLFISEIAEARARRQFLLSCKTLVISLGVVGALFVLTLRCVPRFVTMRDKMGRLLIVLLPFSLFAMHAAINVLGRMNIRPYPYVLQNNSYYTYPTLLAALLSLYALWVFAAHAPSSGRSVRALSIQVVLLFGLLVLSLESGLRVRDLNREIESMLRPRRVMIDTTQKLIDEHQDEPGFCFAFDESAYQAQETFHGLPLGLILFKRYINNHDPRFLLTARDGTLRAQRHTAPGRPGEPQVYPDLVEVGSSYNFYYFDGWYYGVLHWDGHYAGEQRKYAYLIDGHYAGEQRKYAYLIKSRTLEGARGQIPERLEEQRQDLKSGRLVLPDILWAPDPRNRLKQLRGHEDRLPRDWRAEAGPEFGPTHSSRHPVGPGPSQSP